MKVEDEVLGFHLGKDGVVCFVVDDAGGGIGCYLDNS